MIGILGSGFGLYGYVPALIDVFGEDILLPKQYKDKFYSREEVKIYNDRICWVDNKKNLLKMATGLVIAMQPMEQEYWISQALAVNNINLLFLEKPLSRSPESSYKILNKLKVSKKKFRIGYNFIFTEWGKKIRNEIIKIDNNDQLIINWTFMAHHYIYDIKVWKRYSIEGGGIIRFYGIHLIALLSEMGYVNVKLSKSYGPSKNEINRWNAVLSGHNLPNCSIFLDSRSISERFSFESMSNNVSNTIFSLKTPFSLERIDQHSDARVPVLSNLCKSIKYEYEYNKYADVNALWKKIEIADFFQERIV